MVYTLAALNLKHVKCAIGNGIFRPQRIGKISLAEVTLIESPLEFVQQHLCSTITTATITAAEDHHHHHLESAANASSSPFASFGSVWTRAVGGGTAGRSSIVSSLASPSGSPSKGKQKQQANKSLSSSDAGCNSFHWNDDDTNSNNHNNLDHHTNNNNNNRKPLGKCTKSAASHLRPDQSPSGQLTARHLDTIPLVLHCAALQPLTLLSAR